MKNSVCQSSSDVCKLTLITFAFLSFMRIFSLRSRRLEVVGPRKNGRARRTPCVSPSRAPVLSFARYFQAPATQASAFLETGGELESKCVPRLFLGSLLGRVSRLLPVGQHFPLLPVTAPVVFAKVSSAQFTSRFKSGKLEKVFAMCFKLIVLLAAPKENYSPKESYHNGCVYDATSMKVKENRTP